MSVGLRFARFAVSDTLRFMVVATPPMQDLMEGALTEHDQVTARTSSPREGFKNDLQQLRQLQQSQQSWQSRQNINKTFTCAQMQHKKLQQTP
jgi:hypothetical protein